METKIIGDNMQAVVAKLRSGDQLFAEAGSLMYLRGGVKMDVEMRGGLVGGIKRVFGGQSLFMTSFTAENDGGEVGFASPFPGEIMEIKIDDNKEFFCQRDSFLCSTKGVEMDIALTKKLGAGFFGGEGFILQSLKGEGTAFIHAGGNFVKMDLEANESVRVDTGCIVGFDGTVDYDIKFVGGIKRTIFGGEGLFFANLTGPGSIYLQTLPFSRMANRIWEAVGRNYGEKSGMRSGDITTNIGSSIIRDMLGR